MSDQSQSWTYEAPRTWADIFYQGRMYIFIAIIVILAIVFFPKDNIMLWRGLAGFCVGTIITYYIIVFRHGLVIDTSNLASGMIDAYEPQVQELKDLSTRNDAVMLPSRHFGTVLLLGGRYYTGEILSKETEVNGDIIVEEIPVPTAIKPHLVLAMNSLELNNFRSFNEKIIPRWMLLERNLELALQIRQQEELERFREILGLGPMKSTDKEASEKLPE